MAVDVATQQRHIPAKVDTMFSLISLYFSYRRDVVLAERYVATLADKSAQEAAVSAAPATSTAEIEELALAA